MNLVEVLLELLCFVAAHAGEVLDQSGGLLVGQVKTGHAHLQPRSQCFDVLQEAVKPGVLHLGPFAAQVGRSVVLVEE